MEPTIMRARRPILSMTVRAAIVAMRFMRPTATLMRYDESAEAPASWMTTGA